MDLQPASFLSFPGELRNEIYYHVLRYSGERRLSIKLKSSSDGGVYVREQTPLLCYAVPTLSIEMLSVYYRENTLRISLVTQEHRVAFRAWVSQRGSMLQFTKGLKVVFKAPFLEARYRDTGLTAAFGLQRGLQDRISIRFSCYQFCGCACWLAQYVEQDAARLASAQQDTTWAVGEIAPTSHSNLAIDFALRLALVLDACEAEGMDELISLGWYQRYGSIPCECCGAMSVLSLSRETSGYIMGRGWAAE